MPRPRRTRSGLAARTEKRLARAARAVAAATPPTVNLNIGGAVAYLGNARIDALDGLWFAVRDKMTEIGLAIDPAAVISQEAEGTPTGNMRGLLHWVESVAPTAGADEKRALQTVQAVLAARLAMGGRKPKRLDLE